MHCCEVKFAILIPHTPLAPLWTDHLADSAKIACCLVHVLCCAVLCCAVLSQVFTHVTEYLGRDCLDLLVCVDMAAAAVEPPQPASVAGRPMQQQAPALQLLLSGAAPGTNAAGAAAGPTGASTASSSSTGGGSGACCYIINDVNLLTVLETVRLLMDYST